MSRDVNTEGVEPLYSVLEDEHLQLREGMDKLSCYTNKGSVP